MRKVCAWCKAVMVEGDEPTSHGMCEACGKVHGLPALIASATRRRTAANGDAYEAHGVCWLCEAYHADVLITEYDHRFEVYVHAREGGVDAAGAVLAGPYSSPSFDMCAAWGAARAGERLVAS